MNRITKHLLGLSMAIVIAVLLLSATKKPKIKIVDTKTFTCNTSGLAKSYIDSWSKKGYQVQFIISQSVSTSIDNYYHNYISGNSNYRDLRGDIIIIMTKETIQ